MKKLSEFALERGVSEKTIGRRIAEVKKNLVGQLSDKVLDSEGQVSDNDGHNKITKKIKNITYITEYGEKILTPLLPMLKDVSDKVLDTVRQTDGQNVNLSDTVRQPDPPQKTENNEEILFLREQVKSLTEELKTEREHSRQKSDEISELAKKLVGITENQQVLLRAEQARSTPALKAGEEKIETIIEEKTPQSNEKKGFLNFFKRK